MPKMQLILTCSAALFLTAQYQKLVSVIYLSVEIVNQQIISEKMQIT